jgi:hypothetical protein
MYLVTQSCHNMPCIELQKCGIEEMRKLKAAVMTQFMNDPFYKTSRKAGAFLQGYDESSGWILIEFWQKDYQDFINLLNKPDGTTQ